MTDFGPCNDWTPIWTCPERVSTASPTATGYAVAAATEIVWALSGRRFGTCEITLRPCRRECYSDQWWANTGSIWYGGVYAPWGYPYAGPSGYWFDSSCGACSGTCSCSEISEVLLPSPVSSIVSVKMDGTPMATGAYRVDNNRLLVRLDGERWPRCNNLAVADTEPGSWSVTALYGQPVPVAGQLAVGEMACEFLRALAGEDCRLPAGVQSIARQGVTINFPDAGEFLKEGRTGFDLVDRFLAAVNPYHKAQRSRVYSVDRMPHRRAGT